MSPEWADQTVRETARIIVTSLARAARRLRTQGTILAPQDGGARRQGIDTDREHWQTVGIVILTWENYEEVSDCLDSVREISYPDYEVIVVDNGSKDGSLETLKEEYDWCLFVENGENLGFARGNNPGIRKALDIGVDSILLLNDDTIVPEDFLEPLVETMERYDRVAAVGGLNYKTSTGELHNAGYEFIPAFAGQSIRYVRPREVVPYSVGFIQSCLILLDPEFLSEIGLLSENYFIGMEDVDLAWKAHERGWRVLMNPQSKICHRVGVTDERTPFNVYHRTRNRLTFARDNLTGLRLGLFLLSFGVWLIFNTAVWEWKDKSNTARAAKLGILDAIFGAEFRSYQELTG